MPRSNYAHVPQPLSPISRAQVLQLLKPMPPRARALQQEKPPQRENEKPMHRNSEEPLLPATGERPYTTAKTQHSQNKFFF